MTDEISGTEEADAREKVLLRDRLAIVYSLSRYHLFVPFAVLCTAVAPLRHNAAVFWSMLPFILLVAAMAGGNWLREKYQNRDPSDDLSIWATRYTMMSGLVGAIWGIGAIIWFDFSSFASEAYLVLAFLGLSATEFIPRAAYRTAYLAHSVGSLVPLALLLAIQGGVYQSLSAILVLYFAGVLYSYGAPVNELLDQSILLRHDHDALIARLSDQKRLAEATRDTAMENERAKSVFVSNISHELRSPLNAILGMAQLLERSDLAKAQRDHVKVLLESGRSLKTLLDDIIALAGEEGATAPEEGCDAAQAARTVARLLQPNAWEKRLRLSVNVAPGLPRVAADPRLIRRVLLKLIANAIKFTDRGNVEIALDGIERLAGQKMVRFVITDTGPGIPAHLLPAIFEPFVKPDTVPSRHTGVGVGLAVARRLVESVAGTIGVESEPGMGASFWITIPASLDAPLNAHAGEPVAPPSGLPLLAFVPDAGMRDVLTQLLSPSGNRLTFVDSLSQAVTVSARGNFAAIIAPARSVDVLAAAPGQRMPILALLTSDDWIPDGADRVLRWPSTPDALYAAVNAVTADAGKPENQGTGARETSIDSLVDAKAIAELEKSLGFKTLIDILQSYLQTAERLATELALAAERGDWMLTGRIAQDFAGAAGGLGLTAITTAARALSLGARDGQEAEMLSTATAVVLSEHGRARDALRRLYPDLSA